MNIYGSVDEIWDNLADKNSIFLDKVTDYGIPIVTGNLSKYDYHIFYSIAVNRSNPNGDPDSNNQPRTCYDGVGDISGECFRNILRDYFSYKGMPIYYKDNTIKTQTNEEILKQNSLYDQALKEKGLNTLKIKEIQNELKRKGFFDISLFGDMSNTKSHNLGNSVGAFHPVIKTTHPIDIVYKSNTCSTLNNEKELNEETNSGEGHGTFGGSYFVPYAIYGGYGHMMSHRLVKNDVTDEHIILLFKSILNIGYIISSASKQDIYTRNLYVIATKPSEKTARFFQMEENRLYAQLKEGVEMVSTYEDYYIKNLDKWMDYAKNTNDGFMIAI